MLIHPSVIIHDLRFDVKLDISLDNGGVSLSQIEGHEIKDPIDLILPRSVAITMFSRLRTRESITLYKVSYQLCKTVYGTGPSRLLTRKTPILLPLKERTPRVGILVVGQSCMVPIYSRAQRKPTRYPFSINAVMVAR